LPKLDTEQCPLCGEAARHVGQNGRRSTWKCESCDLIFEMMGLIEDARSLLPKPRSVV
jgi:ribosomal protein L37AE/L43A